MTPQDVVVCAIPIHFPQINSFLGARRREDVAVRRELDAVDRRVLATQEHDRRLERRGSGLLVVLFLQSSEPGAGAARRYTRAWESYRHFIVAAALFLRLDDAHAWFEVCKGTVVGGAAMDRSDGVWEPFL